MLDIINRFAHGYVVVPVSLACRRGGLFRILDDAGPRTLQELVAETHANAGHLATALRLFRSLGWIEQDAQGRHGLGVDRALIDAIPEGVLELLDLDMMQYLQGAGGRLTPHIQLSLDGWGIQDPLLTDFLDGVLVLPVLIAVHRMALLGPVGTIAGTPTRTPLGGHPFATCSDGVREELLALFRGKGWLTSEADGNALTPAGAFLVDRALNTGVTVSYTPMLRRMHEVLFGDPSSVFAQDAEGHESHIDRHLNVIGSGFQHDRFFADMDEVVCAIFDAEPLARQPTCVADMGCGDGTLLKRIYTTVRDKTRRGRQLDRYPLLLLGVDFHEESLRATAANLAGLPHRVLHGDIGDPEKLLADLAASGIAAADEILHVRSFLDHERPLVPPRDEAALEAKADLETDAVFVGRDGGLLPPAQMVQGLVEHLDRWARILEGQGLLLLEVHSQKVASVRAQLDQSESLHFDALQAFSSQYLVEPDTFLLAAAEASLFARPGFFRRYPKTLPYTRITLAYFERRPYAVRLACPADLPDLEALEEATWDAPLRSTGATLLRRLATFPSGCCVVTRDGRVLGAVYAQRIRGPEVLEGATYDALSDLHVADGASAQLISINVHPEVSEQGIGDQLLDFMLQYLSVMPGVQQVVGVTRCRDYGHHTHLPVADYIRLTDASGEVRDPILRFHRSHGAAIVKPIEGFRPSDQENKGAGVLIAYDLATGRDSRPAPAAGGGSASSAVAESPAEAVEFCVRAVAELGPTALYDPKSPLMELGLDSLNLLELRTMLSQRLSLSLEPSFFFSYPTPHAIAAYAEGRIRRAAAASADSSPRAETASPALPSGARAESRPTPATTPARAPTSAPTLAQASPHAPVPGAVARADDGEPHAVAIIGMGCRFPGGIDSPESFWQLLVAGRDAVTPMPEARRRLMGLNDGEAGKGTEHGGFLADVDQFDPMYFRIPPTVVNEMDPQHRLLLEVVWEALEDAGHPPATIAGTRTGIYVGIFSHDYEMLQVRKRDPASLNAYFSTGNAISIAAGRLAYMLGARGPTLSVDTACSSSLMAIHLACQSLRLGESRLALAAGVNLILAPQLTAAFANAGMLSPRGRCRTFDADADGYVRSEGCGVLVLKRLADARADGDRVWAVIRGSSVNQDGASTGLTAPNGLAQQELLRLALEDAAVGPRHIDYIEMHGTGTPLGDPVEFGALEAVFGDTGRPRPLILGSVKTNLGHTEAAAGMAGLMKVVLAMREGHIPPHLHLNQVNPGIQLDRLPALVPSQGCPWPQAPDGGPRRAGVSSFGFSGTNTHVILEGFDGAHADATGLVREWQLLPLSAHQGAALDQLRAAYIARLQQAGPAADTDAGLQDLAYSAATGRDHLRHRIAVVARDGTAACQVLAAPERMHPNAKAIQGDPAAAGRPKVAFLFSGQGSQYKGMGQALYREQPRFRALIDRCDAILRPQLEPSLLDVLFDEAVAADLIDQTRYTQVGLFAFEYALAEVWRSWGIEPDLVMGHSVGEYVAACVAGVMSFEDALGLVADRARLMDQAPGDGAMAVVFADVATVDRTLAAVAGPEVVISSINGDKSNVISGKRAALDAVRRAFKDAGVDSMPLQVSHAFHSPQMEPVCDAFRERVARVPLAEPEIPLVANLTGRIADRELTSPDYWCRQLREPVRLAASMQTLVEQRVRVFLEVGPKPAIINTGKHCVADGQGTWLPSVRQERPPWQDLLTALGTLYVQGFDVDWRQVFDGVRPTRVALPRYPLRKQRCWFEAVP